MPTTRPRHMITETSPVEEALDELRAELGEERIDFAELVAIGAREKARTLRSADAASAAARKRLADQVRSGVFPFEIDLEAADEVKRLGLDPLGD